MPIFHSYLQYCMKFQILRFPRYLDDFFCPTMNFWEQIDYLRSARMPRSLKNHVQKLICCLKICYFYGLYSWAPEKLWVGPDWLAGIENASKQPAWMGRIEIIYFGPQIDLSSTPRPPKGPVLLQNCLLESLGGPRSVPKGHILSQLLPVSWHVLVSRLSCPCNSYWKGPVLIQKHPLQPSEGPWGFIKGPSKPNKFFGGT